MKTKNVIFRLLAVLVAVGGAVASVNASLSPLDAHLSYMTTGGAGFCTTIAPNPCGDAGEVTCQVRIGVNGAATVVTAWAHRVSPGVCQTRLTKLPPGGAINVPVNKTIPSGSTILN